MFKYIVQKLCHRFIRVNLRDKELVMFIKEDYKIVDKFKVALMECLSMIEITAYFLDRVLTKISRCF